MIRYKEHKTPFPVPFLLQVFLRVPEKFPLQNLFTKRVKKCKCDGPTMSLHLYPVRTESKYSGPKQMTSHQPQTQFTGGREGSFDPGPQFWHPLGPKGGCVGGTEEGREEY